MAELAGAEEESPVCAGGGLSPVTATLTYDMPDTFVMEIDGDMVSLAAIRRLKPIPSSDGKQGRLLLQPLRRLRQRRDRHVERCCDPLDRVPRRIGFAALDQRERVGGDARLPSQSVQAGPLLLAQLANGPAKRGLWIRRLSRLRLQDISIDLLRFRPST